MNYWIFQGKPTAYKFQSAVNKDLLKEWNIKQHIGKIRKGDKAIIWLCGETPGIYGLVDILTNPTITGKADDYSEWIPNDHTGRRHQNDDEIANKVKIEFTHDLFNKGEFISREHIPDTSGALGTLKLKGFIQGKTNLISSKEQFQMVIDLIENKGKAESPSTTNTY